MNMCSQLGDLIFQMFDVLAALVNLREVGGFEGVGRVRAAWRIHINHLKINTM
jgi:hypothetical protein